MEKCGTVMTIALLAFVLVSDAQTVTVESKSSQPDANLFPPNLSYNPESSYALSSWTSDTGPPAPGSHSGNYPGTTQGLPKPKPPKIINHWTPKPDPAVYPPNAGGFVVDVFNPVSAQWTQTHQGHPDFPRPSQHSENIPSSQGFSSVYSGSHHLSQGTPSVYPASPEAPNNLNQWNREKQLSHGVVSQSNPPVNGPVNPSPSQAGNTWTSSGRHSAKSQSSQSGSRWGASGQTGGQWSGSGTQSANLKPSKTSSGNQHGASQASQTDSHWGASSGHSANSQTSPTGSRWIHSGSQPSHPQPNNKPVGHPWTNSGHSQTQPSGAGNAGQKSEPSTLDCEVAVGVRVPCGPPNISPADCRDINCCFDGQSCYFAKAVTVQCTKDGQFIVVASKDSTTPALDLTSVSLLETGPGCSYADSNSQFVIYQFPVTTCGSVVLEDSDTIIYENSLFSSYEVGFGPYGTITRDSQFEMLFQCKYTGSSVETLIVEVVKMDNPVLPVAAAGPLNVQLRLGNGQCQTKGCNEDEAAYSSYHSEYPVTKVLREPVYVEVRLMDSTDPSLVLTLARCWVTSRPSPHSLPQWDVLLHGCPNRDDRYFSALVPITHSSRLHFPTHFRRFAFQMFTFVDPSSLSHLSQQIYIHCSTDVCEARHEGSCEPLCHYRKRRAAAVKTDGGKPKAVHSIGPILMIDRMNGQKI